MVNLIDITCSCDKWEVVGIQCKHVMHALWDTIQNLKNLVHNCYMFCTWKEMYKFKVNPTNRRNMWAKSDCPTKLTPPKTSQAVKFLSK